MMMLQHKKYALLLLSLSLIDYSVAGNVKYKKSHQKATHEADTSHLEPSIGSPSENIGRTRTNPNPNLFRKIVNPSVKHEKGIYTFVDGVLMFHYANSNDKTYVYSNEENSLKLSEEDKALLHLIVNPILASMRNKTNGSMRPYTGPYHPTKTVSTIENNDDSSGTNVNHSPTETYSRLVTWSYVTDERGVVIRRGYPPMMQNPPAKETNSGHPKNQTYPSSVTTSTAGSSGIYTATEHSTGSANVFISTERTPEAMSLVSELYNANMSLAISNETEDTVAQLFQEDSKEHVQTDNSDETYNKILNGSSIFSKNMTILNVNPDPLTIDNKETGKPLDDSTTEGIVWKPIKGIYTTSYTPIMNKLKLTKDDQYILTKNILASIKQFNNLKSNLSESALQTYNSTNDMEINSSTINLDDVISNELTTVMSNQNNLDSTKLDYTSFLTTTKHEINTNGGMSFMDIIGLKITDNDTGPHYTVIPPVTMLPPPTTTESPSAFEIFDMLVDRYVTDSVSDEITNTDIGDIIRIDTTSLDATTTHSSTVDDQTPLPYLNSSNLFTAQIDAIRKIINNSSFLFDSSYSDGDEQKFHKPTIVYDGNYTNIVPISDIGNYLEIVNDTENFSEHSFYDEINKIDISEYDEFHYTQYYNNSDNNFSIADSSDDIVTNGNVTYHSRNKTDAPTIKIHTFLGESYSPNLIDFEENVTVMKLLINNTDQSTPVVINTLNNDIIDSILDENDLDYYNYYDNNEYEYTYKNLDDEDTKKFYLDTIPVTEFRRQVLNATEIDGTPYDQTRNLNINSKDTFHKKNQAEIIRKDLDSGNDDSDHRYIYLESDGLLH